MADKLAMKFGKRYMNKKMKSEDSGNVYKYVKGHTKRGEKILEKKDMDYFVNILNIPERDAKILYKVMKSARSLDGHKVGPFRFGKSTIIGLFPAFGDAINGLLSMSIIWKADKVTDGLENGVRAKMVFNVVVEVAIGATPILGDFCDTLWQANSKNALLLEKILRERVQKAQKELESAEKDGRVHNTHNTRVQVHTDGQYDSEARTETPPTHDDRHAALRQRVLAGDKTNSTKVSQNNGGGLMKKFQGRDKTYFPDRDQTMAQNGNGALAAQPRPARDVRGHGTTRDELAAPERPPRSGNTRHHPVGSF